MRKKPGFKLFVIMLFCTGYIFSFSHFGAIAYHSILGDHDSFEEKTIIGSINVSGKTKEEAIVYLNQQVQQWSSAFQINLHFKEKSVPLDGDFIIFHVQSSVESAQNGMKNALIADMSSNDLNGHLVQAFPSVDWENVDLKKLKGELLRNAMLLQSGTFDVHLEDYLITAVPQDDIVGQANIKIGKEFEEIQELLPKLGEIPIPAKSQFSLLEYLEKQKLNAITSTSLSAIASGIYQAVLPTNFSIIERHISKNLPDYAALGYEAKVDQSDNRDLIFSNLNASNFRLVLSLKDETLTVHLKGPSFLYKYEVKGEGLEEFKPKTVIQYSSLLAQGEKEVVEQGKEGLLIKMIRNIWNENNDLLEQETISEDFYAPIHRIERSSLKAEIKKEIVTEDDGKVIIELPEATPELNEDKEVLDQDVLESELKDETLPKEGTEEKDDTLLKPSEDEQKNNHQKSGE